MRDIDDLLRDVTIEGYRLRTWDTRRSHHGKSRIAYQFDGKDGQVIFAGDDFYCSPLHAIDSDACLRALMAYITLRPGDTDRDYFDSYTPEQMAFAQGDAESLSLYAMDEEIDGVVVEFEDTVVPKV